VRARFNAIRRSCAEKDRTRDLQVPLGQSDATDLQKSLFADEQLASSGHVRAIFDASDVYAWDPMAAFHDDVFKSLGLAEIAICAIINVDRKTVRVVRGSQRKVSQARQHPYTKKLRYEVVAENETRLSIKRKP